MHFPNLRPWRLLMRKSKKIITIIMMKSKNTVPIKIMISTKIVKMIMMRVNVMVVKIEIMYGI